MAVEIVATGKTCRRPMPQYVREPNMAEKMPKMSREFLEEECLRVARRALGCRDLTAVKIARADPPGSGPNWYVKEFVPPLPPIAEREARELCVRLAGQYALMGQDLK